MSIDWRRARGLSLIEQIIFIVVISIGVVGLLASFNRAVQDSADPMVTRQTLAVAESLLEEILQQPFTWCDPDDPNAASAMGFGDCTAGMAQSGVTPVPGGESRNGGPGAVFDHVADYGGYGQGAASDAIGGQVMDGYATQVTITQAGAAFGLANDAVLRVTVRVTRGPESLDVTGYRFRYAPRY